MVRDVSTNQQICMYEISMLQLELPVMIYSTWESVCNKT